MNSWANMCLPKCIGGLGFRDMKVFNAALLAKPTWRLMTNANPLLTVVLKAKYFKKSSVLEANRGHYPSYTWRSIWGAKSLVLEGLAWRIGNGTMVKALYDKWVPFNDNMAMPRPIASAPSDLSVADLIDFNEGGWDYGALNQWFDEETIDAIFSIPIFPPWSNDKMFWWLSKNGIYTVKSGYLLGLLGTDGVGTDPDELMNRKQWSRMWNLPTPPKLCHFLWRMCRGSLATKQSLFNRYVVPSPICDRCGSEVESILHVLCDAPRSSVMDFVKWISNHSSQEEFLSICTTMWAAWLIRNKTMFTNEIVDALSLLPKYTSWYKIIMLSRIRSALLLTTMSYVLHHGALR